MKFQDLRFPRWHSKKNLVGNPVHCERRSPLSRLRERGAIAVEYALGMVIAAVIMVSVEPLMFRPMAKEILSLFNDLVSVPYP
jgi:hypothetical protein